MNWILRRCGCFESTAVLESHKPTESHRSQDHETNDADHEHEHEHETNEVDQALEHNIDLHGMRVVINPQGSTASDGFVSITPSNAFVTSCVTPASPSIDDTRGSRRASRVCFDDVTTHPMYQDLVTHHMCNLQPTTDGGYYFRSRSMEGDHSKGGGVVSKSLLSKRSVV